MAKLYSAIHHKFEGELALTRRRRNSALPIHRLPNDLLVNIFLISMHPKEDTQVYARQRVTTESVCDLWRTTIRTTATFWSVVSSTLPPRINERSLQLSKGHSLTCIAKERPPNDDSWKYTHEHTPLRDGFWESIRPYANRIGTIIAGPSSGVLDMVTEGLNKLVELNIDNRAGLSMFHGRSISPKLALVPSLESPWPRLKYLQLRGLSLPWSHSVISNIISLRLFEVAHLPVDILMDVLRDSPHLAELQLHSVELAFSVDTTIELTSFPTIPFSQLRSLEIKDMPSNVIQYILNGIEPQPTLDQLQICYRHFFPNYMEPFNPPHWTLKSALDHLLKSDSGANRVIICHDRVGNSVECRSLRSPGFHINVLAEKRFSWIGQVLDLYPASAPRLEVEWEETLDFDGFDAFWEARLTRFDVILKLSSPITQTNSEGALQKLCQPPFPLPSLIELVIFVGLSSATLIANLMEARYGTSYSYGVTPLQKLKYYTTGDRLVEQLEGRLSLWLPDCSIEWVQTLDMMHLPFEDFFNAEIFGGFNVNGSIIDE
jgi:hypothetical protein